MVRQKKRDLIESKLKRIEKKTNYPINAFNQICSGPGSSNSPSKCGSWIRAWKKSRNYREDEIELLNARTWKTKEKKKHKWLRQFQYAFATSIVLWIIKKRLHINSIVFFFCGALSRSALFLFFSSLEWSFSLTAIVRTIESGGMFFVFIVPFLRSKWASLPSKYAKAQQIDQFTNSLSAARFAAFQKVIRCHTHTQMHRSHLFQWCLDKLFNALRLMRRKREKKTFFGGFRKCEAF